MVNALIGKSVEHEILPLAWKLWGSTVERGDTNTTFASNWTDGYMITARLGWKAVDINGEFAEDEGTLGACIESLDQDGMALG